MTVSLSVQMCYRATDKEDTANSLSFVWLFTIVKVWFFTSPPLFTSTFYPISLGGSTLAMTPGDTAWNIMSAPGISGVHLEYDECT